MKDAAQRLVDRYRGVAPDGLRLAVWYEGDEYEVAYVREDVKEAYSPEELEEKVKQLVVEGLSDSPNQEQFRLLGKMTAAVRTFERAVVLHFPIDEFSGLAVTFDADDSLSLDELADVGVETLGQAAVDQ